MRRTTLFILIIQAVILGGDLRYDEDWTYHPSVPTATLDKALADRNWDRAIRLVCPPSRRGDGCLARFRAQNQAGDALKPYNMGVAIKYDEQGDHVNYKFPFLFLKTFLIHDSQMLDYALHEANIGLKVRDSIQANNIENLVPIMDCCTDTEQVGFNSKFRIHMKFKLYENGSLREFMANDKDNEVVFHSNTWKMWTVRGMINAVATLHSRNYAHRDIKPDNVLCESAGWKCALGDYGFNKKIAGTTDTMGGTPIFMPPEMKQGLEYNLSIDIWNLGALIHYITYQPTFRWTANWHDRIMNDCQEEYGPHTRVEPLNEKYVYCTYFHKLVKSMLNKDPAQRPTAAQALEGMEDLWLAMVTTSEDFYMAMKEDAFFCQGQQKFDMVDRFWSMYTSLHKKLMEWTGVEKGQVFFDPRGLHFKPEIFKKLTMISHPWWWNADGTFNTNFQKDREEWEPGITKWIIETHPMTYKRYPHYI